MKKPQSPLVQVILAIFFGYFIITLLWVGYGWFKQEYPNPPRQTQNTSRVQHPFYHHQAENALRSFLSLSNNKKKAIRENLESNLLPIDDWLKQLNESDFQVLCLGELHEESTRNFLAKRFFPIVKPEVLLLEATPKELKHFRKKLAAGRTYFPLLGADILSILRAATAVNPKIRIYGIEETKKQNKEEMPVCGTRDSNISNNFWKIFQPGKRHVILFGALHCANESCWLFENLREMASPSLKSKMTNMWVLEEHQYGPLEAFIYFLDRIGIARKSFVIPETQNIHPAVLELLPFLDHRIIKIYQTLIAFRLLA